MVEIMDFSAIFAAAAMFLPSSFFWERNHHVTGRAFSWPASIKRPVRFNPLLGFADRPGQTLGATNAGDNAQDDQIDLGRPRTWAFRKMIKSHIIASLQPPPRAIADTARLMGFAHTHDWSVSLGVKDHSDNRTSTKLLSRMQWHIGPAAKASHGAGDHEDARDFF